MGPSYSLLLWIVSHCSWLPEPRSWASKAAHGGGVRKNGGQPLFPSRGAVHSLQSGWECNCCRKARSLLQHHIFTQRTRPSSHLPSAEEVSLRICQRRSWRLRTIMISYRNIYFLHTLKCVYFLQAMHIFNSHRTYLWWTEQINPFVIYGSINGPSVLILVHYKYILICTCTECICTTQHSITYMNCKNCVCKYTVLQN